MKTKIYNILLVIGLISCIGCSDFLDEKMQGTYSNSTFYKTEEHAYLALVSCYEPLAFTDIEQNLWVYGDVASDDALKGGNSGDQSDITYIQNFTAASDNGYLTNTWTHYYEGIARTNLVTTYVPNIDFEEESLKAQYVAEAKFLRAFYYFNLVNIFGEIPLKTVAPETTDDLQVAKSSVSEIYAQIEEDLIDAAADLPSSVSSANYGRASKGAAFGMLAKVYLYQEEWQNALNYIDSLDNLDQYSLVNLYSHNFMVDYENNSESIFEIQHLAGQDPSTGSCLNQWFAPTEYNGYYFNVPRQDFIDEFETATNDTIYDPRLDYTVGREGKKWLNGEDFDPDWSPTGYLQKKHLQPLDEIPESQKGDGDLNYTYLRYADILLMKAEALNELGSTGEALTPLNLVRERAKNSYLYDEDLNGYGTVPDGLLADVSSTDQSEVRTAIRHERRVELGFEFHRFFDLMRYGKTTAEETLNYVDFNYDEDRYFAIPLSEEDTNKEL